jgi:predicted flap endonuclease-1-like 5' DNA nuclease
MASIETIEGIGTKYGERMRSAGIRSTGALLKAGANPKGRAALAEKTGFSNHQILEWTNRADLMRVRGVGEEYSDLLEAAGVDTVKELRNRNPENLLAKMEEVNAAKKLVRRTPALSVVKRWIAHAKELPPVMTY